MGEIKQSEQKNMERVDTSGWIKRKARVGRCCGGTNFAKGCERTIDVGEFFMQSPYRVGLDHLELCMECGGPGR